MSDRVSAMESHADCEVEGRTTYWTKRGLYLKYPQNLLLQNSSIYDIFEAE